MSPPTPSQPSTRKPTKRARLPPNTKISKRPLSHPSIPTPRTSNPLSPQTIYLRARTPFIPTIKRIQKLLGIIQSRHTQSLLSRPRRNGPLTAAYVEKHSMEELRAERERGRKAGEGQGGFAKPAEAVHVRASGRAIERALGVAGWFWERGGVRVRVRTGTVGAVDDLEEERRPMGEGNGGGTTGGEVESGGRMEEDRSLGDEEDAKDGGAVEEDDEEEVEVPEVRIRQINYVEVAISAT